MSVSEKFQSFCANLRMDPAVVSNIQYRYKRITKTLNKEYWDSESEVNHSLYVGSYGRGTDIRYSDIDMLFQLPYATYKKFDDYTGNGQSALLQEVKRAVEKTYKSSMKGDGQVIVISFTDGSIIELVPCFIYKDDSYTYPDTHDGGTWKKTNPKPEIKEINDANNRWNKNLKRLCRMARAWKYQWDVPIGGLLIDTLAYNFLKDWSNRDKSFLYYDYMTRDFFKYLKDQNEDQSYWYSPGANQQVYRTGKFEYKALRCYNISLEAIKFEQDHKEWSANKKWREIYGSKFPS